MRRAFLYYTGQRLFFAFLFPGRLLLQGRAQNVAQAGAAVGRAILLDGFLLFRHFASLDGERDLAARLVHAGDQGFDLVALSEAFGPLVVAVARQVGAADEGADAAFQFHLDATVIDLGDRAGDDLVLAQRAAAGTRLLNRIALQLLDAQADAFLLHVDVQHLG